jgi:hypothetical protein
MPILPGSSTSNSTSLQQIVNEMRAYPEFIPVLGTSGYTTTPFLRIANDIMQRILSESMPWKWNRSYVPAFLTVALQQDYVTQITDIGWLEYADRLDINNSTNNGNLAPKPTFEMETVRDLRQTAGQAVPFQISFMPNKLAFMGVWTANTVIGCGYGVAQIPISPIQQFIDANGNILYIDSTQLGLSISSPGFTNTPITLPTPNPYGTTGSTQPLAPANATPGYQVTDGTVTWTVADPNGYAMRVAPLPAFSGLEWLVTPTYQRKPPTLTSITGSTIYPIPPELTYLFIQGCRAKLYEHAGSNKAEAAYAKWEEMLVVAVRGADRQAEECSFVPTNSVMGDASTSQVGIGAGPSWPFGPAMGY